MPKKDARPYIKLQYFAQEIEEIPPEWEVIDEKFSKDKKLFDYQVQALQNAIKVLYKYFEEWQESKEELAKVYQDLEIYEQLNVKLKNHKYSELLREFYDTEYDEKGNEIIPFREFSNRMSFWMATGSGKTLIIIKLVEALHELMERGLIPKKEILFLTYREDLLNTFKNLLEEYNKARPLKEQITCLDLKKDYENVKKQETIQRRIFVYRSDLISDERKENILNFRDYLTEEDGKVFGDWFLILDEAHKGDKDESKRKVLFSILSKKGFLFNFSATFTEAEDIITTVYNLNLSEFINSGYGKQIYVSRQEARAFKEKEDYTDKEKKKIILKTLITLTAIKKAYENIKKEKMYHRPMLVYLVNSVNVQDSDLKLVFDQISKLAKEINEEVFSECKKELLEEFKSSTYTLGEKSETLKFFEEFLSSIDVKEVLKQVYNSETHGSVEYIINPNNKKEIALKLDSSDSPFALIRIGETSKWTKEFLHNYKENETFEEKSFFENLNDENNPVNILLGSRAFYEGWDSNRPNVITFINVGTGTDARKFVLQSIGRGIRIEPVKNKRKRLNYLAVNDEKLKEVYEKYKKESKTLETLVVFATNRKAIETILTELQFVMKAQGYETVELQENEKAGELLLLIPVYKKSEQKITDKDNPPKFRMSEANLKLLKTYVENTPKEKLILENEISPKQYKELKKALKENEKLVSIDNTKNYRTLKALFENFTNYLSVQTEELNSFKILQNEIVHFKKIKVREDYLKEFSEKVEKVKEGKMISDEEKAREVMKLVGEENLSFEEALRKVQENYKDFEEIDGVKLRKLLQHYYIPIVYSNDKKEWIKHIISTESEYEFIEALLKVLNKIDEKYDCWMFSKLDEHLDKEIYIPYISEGKLRKFIPDFIFWLRKGKDYTILFIDPKSYKFTNYENKVEGYRAIFTNGSKEKVFNYKGLKVRVRLKLFTPEGKDKLGETSYKDFWIDKGTILDYF